MVLTTYTFRGQVIRATRLASDAKHCKELALRRDMTPEQRLGAPVASYLRERGVIGVAVIRPFELKRDDIPLLREIGFAVRGNGYNNGLMLREAREVITSRVAGQENLNSLFHIDHGKAMRALSGLLKRPDKNLEKWNDLTDNWLMVGRRKTRLNLSGLDLSGLQLPRVQLPSTDFTFTNLSGVNMSGGWLSHSFFVRSDLRNADMRSTHLWYAMFHKSEMDGSDFSGAAVTDGVRRDVQQHARYESLRMLAA